MESSMDQPTRRELLGGTAALLGLGTAAGCQSLVDPQGDVPEQYGTPDESMQLLQSNQAIVGESPTGRPLISNGDATIYVDPNNGDDSASGTEDNPLQTIQTAVRRVPIYLRHQYTIDLATVPETPVSYDEDVIVPAVIGTGQAGKEENAEQPGPINNLVIRGAESNPDAVKVGSFMFANVLGTSAGKLMFTTVTRDSPYDDEQSGVTAYGTGEVHLYDIKFTDGATNGVLAYGAKMKASNIHLGDGNLQTGIHGKRHASIITTEVDGQTTDAAFRSTSNSTLTVREGNRASGNPQFLTRVGGLAYNLESDTWRGVNTNVPQSDQSDTQASQEVAGEIWYEDGSGEADEGFYGRTQDGPVKLG